MKTAWRQLLAGGMFALCGAVASATDLTLHLAGSGAVSIKSVLYQCDAAGVKIGLPAGPFPVQYANGAGNSLAIVPVHGNSLIMANVTSGSGARYSASWFTWWEAGGKATFYSDSLAGKAQSACAPVPKR